MEEKENSTTRPSTSGDNVVVHARVFAAAVKYQVRALREEAAAKFAAAAKVSWDHPSFAKAARITYTTTAEDVRELRDIVGKTIHSHQSLFDKSSIEKTVRSIDALNWELGRLGRGLPAVAERNAEEDCVCAGCGGKPFFVECEGCGADYMGCCYGGCQSCPQ